MGFPVRWRPLRSASASGNGERASEPTSYRCAAVPTRLWRGVGCREARAIPIVGRAGAWMVSVSADDHFTAKLPAKRMAADCLIADEAGRLLVLDLPYKSTWDIPGGAVERTNRRGAPRSARSVKKSDSTFYLAGCWPWTGSRATATSPR